MPFDSCPLKQRQAVPGIVATISGYLQAHSDLHLSFQDVHHEGALLPLPQQQLPILIGSLWQPRPQHTCQMILHQAVKVCGLQQMILQLASRYQTACEVIADSTACSAVVQASAHL